MMNLNSISLNNCVSARGAYYGEYRTFVVQTSCGFCKIIFIEKSVLARYLYYYYMKWVLFSETDKESKKKIYNPDMSSKEKFKVGIKQS